MTEEESIIKLERKLYQNNKTLALTIPREIVEAWDAKKGDTVLFMSKDGDIVIRKKRVFDGVRFR
jgi:antitoxin component of MazEF toxin-antitoxin module